MLFCSYLILQHVLDDILMLLVLISFCSLYVDSFVMLCRLISFFGSSSDTVLILHALISFCVLYMDLILDLSVI